MTECPTVNETISSIMNGETPCVSKTRNIISKFFNKVVPEIDKPLFAKEAYMQARYGSFKKNDKELLKTLFKKINDRIDSYSKSESGSKYSCMVEINNDIKKYSKYIADFYRDNLGYDVILIDNSSNLNGEQLSYLDTTYLIINWQRNKDINTIEDFSK